MACPKFRGDFPFAMVVPSSHLRAASTILHELVHSEAMEWSQHLRNECFDPCVLVQSAWHHGMALRFPELRASSCCDGITQPSHFMDTVRRGQPCY